MHRTRAAPRPATWPARQQHRDEHADDPDDGQQLGEGERGLGLRRSHGDLAVFLRLCGHVPGITNDQLALFGGAVHHHPHHDRARLAVEAEAGLAGDVAEQGFAVRHEKRVARTRAWCRRRRFRPRGTPRQRPPACLSRAPRFARTTCGLFDSWTDARFPSVNSITPSFGLPSNGENANFPRPTITGFVTRRCSKCTGRPSFCDAGAASPRMTSSAVAPSARPSRRASGSARGRSRPSPTGRAPRRRAGRSPSTLGPLAARTSRRSRPTERSCRTRGPVSEARRTWRQFDCPSRPGGIAAARNIRRQTSLTASPGFRP